MADLVCRSFPVPSEPKAEANGSCYARKRVSFRIFPGTCMEKPCSPLSHADTDINVYSGQMVHEQDVVCFIAPAEATLPV